MALVLCHGPKGGAGSSFLAAHVAMGLVETCADVTLLTTATLDSLPLHFALPPSTRLPSLDAPTDQAVVASGISLRGFPRAGGDPDFVPMLRDYGYLEFGRVLIIDLPAADLELARALAPLAQIHLCTITASPECLALLPDYLDSERGCWSDRTAVVINKFDETRRLARHTAAFLRELLGPRLMGRVRRDEAVAEALAMVGYLARYAPASSALADARAIAAEVAGRLTVVETDGAEALAQAAGRTWVA